MSCANCSPLLSEGAGEAATLTLPELFARLRDCDCDSSSATPGATSSTEQSRLAGLLKEAAELHFAQERALKKVRNEVRELREASRHDSQRVEKLEALQKESMRQADGELAAKMAVVTRQQAAILALSTPIIEVVDGVLVLPLIGTIDDERAQNLAENLLAEITRSRARYAILDLTGVSMLDQRTARLLSRVASAVRLLGAQTLLSGISPLVARELVGMGESVADLLTARSLKDALRYCTRTGP